MKMPSGRIEAIFWLDAMYDSKVKDLEGVMRASGLVQMTVGFVLPPAGDGLLRVVAEMSLSVNNWYQHLIVIPEGMVIKRVKLPMDSVRNNWARLSKKHDLPTLEN